MIIGLINHRQVLLVINNFDKFLLDAEFSKEFKKVINEIKGRCPEARFLYTVNSEDEIDHKMEDTVEIKGLKLE